MNVDRALASIRRISSITPIEGSSFVSVARIDGWDVVVRRDEFCPGDLCCYIEIDSWVPKSIAPFLFKGKTYKGVEGARLRTAKIRGKISQGLVLSKAALPEEVSIFFEDVWEGADLTNYLNIQKWEPSVPANLAGSVKSTFPTHILSKTDQVRVQNITKTIANCYENGVEFTVSEKLDGSSMTCYLHKEVFGVCSRNMDLYETEDNSFWKAARKYKIEEKLKLLKEIYGSEGVAFQGELIGPGIQGNPYNLNELKFYIFDVIILENSNNKILFHTKDLLDLMKKLELDFVPVFENVKALPDVDSYLAMADGQSALYPLAKREGLVFRALNYYEKGDPVSFKVISNAWLL